MTGRPVLHGPPGVTSAAAPTATTTSRGAREPSRPSRISGQFRASSWSSLTDEGVRPMPLLTAECDLHGELDALPRTHHLHSRSLRVSAQEGSRRSRLSLPADRLHLGARRHRTHRLRGRSSLSTSQSASPVDRRATGRARPGHHQHGDPRPGRSPSRPCRAGGRRRRSRAHRSGCEVLPQVLARPGGRTSDRSRPTAACTCMAGVSRQHRRSRRGRRQRRGSASGRRRRSSLIRRRRGRE